MQKVVLLYGALCLLWVGCQPNHPPDKPHSPTPADGAINIPDSLTLNWQCSDVDGDSLRYGLYFGTDSVPPLKSESIATGSFLLTNLMSGTTYYWRVAATDPAGSTSESPIWHFTTVAPAGALWISSSPSGAWICIDGVNTGLMTDAVLVNVPTGKHQLKLCLNGYCDCIDSVVVVEKDTVLVSKVLIQAGVVEVTSMPTGARVLVDGSETGSLTNCSLQKVPVGSRTITLIKTGYQDWTKTVNVTPYEKVQISAQLVARYGSIQITSQPNNAEVWFDGQKTGLKTNCVLNNVLEGNHSVILKRAGYLDWSQTVTVKEGTTTGLDADLVGLGFISVRSTPENAEVTLDGQDLGLVTPCLLTKVTEGSHTLSLKLKDYRVFTQSVTIVVAETTAVDARLQHETGRIQVNSTPAAAAVTLDGLPTNLKTPCTIESVWTGKHRLSLDLVGKYPFADSVEVQVDQTVRVDTMLIPCEIGSFGNAISAGKVCVAGKYAVIANGNLGIIIADVSNPIHPTQVGALAVGDYVQAIAVAGNYIYLGTWASGFSVVNMTNPAAPAVAGALHDSSTVQGIAVAGSYVYVVDKQGNFRTIDISVPSQPTEVASFPTGGTGEGIAVVDRYAYVAGGANGLMVFDVSVPADPKLVGQSTGALYAIDVEVSDDYAYVCDWKTGVIVFDIRNKILPVAVETFYTQGSAEGLTLAGTCVYLADGVAGLRVLDCRVPSALFELGWEITPGYASGVSVSGPLAYVANGGSGVRIIRIGW